MAIKFVLASTAIVSFILLSFANPSTPPWKIILADLYKYVLGAYSLSFL